MYGIAAALEPSGSSGGSESNPRDVVFAFFGTAWSGAVNRDFVMPEDRLAVALLEHPDVRAPVAAVDLAPIAAVEEKHVFLAPAGGDIVPAVARALADGRASEEERRAFLQRHSWGQRVDRILGLALAA